MAEEEKQPRHRKSADTARERGEKHAKKCKNKRYQKTKQIKRQDRTTI